MNHEIKEINTDALKQFAPYPNLKPRCGENKMVFACPGSVLSGYLPLIPLGFESVDLRSPSLKGQPVGLGAERSDGFKYHHRSTPSENTSKGVRLSRDKCCRSWL